MYPIIALPYSYDALKPYVSEETLHFHHDKHYENYVRKLNGVLEKVGYKGHVSKEELIYNIELFPIEERDQILYNAGGSLNHELYFSTMSGNKNTYPKGPLLDAIIRDFGSFDHFKEEFIRHAKLLVGSGYTFLVMNRDQKLEIINMSNQETPYLYQLIPIMTIDLWEHAYYLDYQNRRDDYIQNFFEIVDFVEIGKLYEKNLSQSTF